MEIGRFRKDVPSVFALCGSDDTEGTTCDAVKGVAAEQTTTPMCTSTPTMASTTRATWPCSTPHDDDDDDQVQFDLLQPGSVPRRPGSFHRGNRGSSRSRPVRARVMQRELNKTGKNDDAQLGDRGYSSRTRAR